MIRVFLGLAIFIRLTFDLVPVGFGIAAAVSRQSLDPFRWLNVLEWALAGAIAFGFIVFARVGERIPESRPGLGLITAALVIDLILGVAVALAFAGMQNAAQLVVGLVVAFLVSPIAVLANVLLTIGIFQLLFSLESIDDQPAVVIATPGPPPPTVAPTVRPQPAPGPVKQIESLDKARVTLAALVKGSASEEALSMLQACLEKDPQFKPAPEQIVPLAKLAIARDQPTLALRIMNQFERLNPGHVSLPTVYFLSARALRDLKQRAQARQILDLMLKRFPDNPLARDAQMLREGLERA